MDPFRDGSDSITTDTELLTADDVAAMLGVNRAWVHRAARNNKIPTIHLGRYQRFRRESIEQWIKDMERPAKP